MNRALWKKAIHESSLLFVGCGTVLYFFCWVRVWITSRLDMGRFQTILENLPASWQKLAPVPIDQLFSYEGRIAVTYEEPVVYLMMAIWTIARSSDAVSGGLGRGTMEMLLAAAGQSQSCDDHPYRSHCRGRFIARGGRLFGNVHGDFHDLGGGGFAAHQAALAGP